jgi:hypothetical protein
VAEVDDQGVRYREDEHPPPIVPRLEVIHVIMREHCE